MSIKNALELAGIQLDQWAESCPDDQETQEASNAIVPALKDLERLEEAFKALIIESEKRGAVPKTLIAQSRAALNKYL